MEEENGKTRGKRKTSRKKAKKKKYRDAEDLKSLSDSEGREVDEKLTKRNKNRRKSFSHFFRKSPNTTLPRSLSVKRPSEDSRKFGSDDDNDLVDGPPGETSADQESGIADRGMCKGMTVRQALVESRKRGKSPSKELVRLQKKVLSDRHHPTLDRNMSSSLPHLPSSGDDVEKRVDDREFRKGSGNDSRVASRNKKKGRSKSTGKLSTSKTVTNEPRKLSNEDSTTAEQYLPLDKRKYMIERPKRSIPQPGEQSVQINDDLPHSISNTDVKVEKDTESFLESENRRQSFSTFLQLSQKTPSYKTPHGRSTSLENPDSVVNHDTSDENVLQDNVEDSVGKIGTTLQSEVQVHHPQGEMKKTSIEKGKNANQNSPRSLSDVVSDIRATDQHPGSDEPGKTYNATEVQKDTREQTKNQTNEAQLPTDKDEVFHTEEGATKTGYISPRRFSKPRSTSSANSESSKSDIVQSPDERIPTSPQVETIQKEKETKSTEKYQRKFIKDRVSKKSKKSKNGEKEKTDHLELDCVENVDNKEVNSKTHETNKEGNIASVVADVVNTVKQNENEENVTKNVNTENADKDKQGKGKTMAMTCIYNKPDQHLVLSDKSSKRIQTPDKQDTACTDSTECHENKAEKPENDGTVIKEKESANSAKDVSESLSEKKNVDSDRKSGSDGNLTKASPDQKKINSLPEATKLGKQVADNKNAEKKRKLFRVHTTHKIKNTKEQSRIAFKSEMLSRTKSSSEGSLHMAVSLSELFESRKKAGSVDLLNSKDGQDIKLFKAKSQEKLLPAGATNSNENDTIVVEKVLDKEEDKSDDAAKDEKPKSPVKPGGQVSFGAIMALKRLARRKKAKLAASAAIVNKDDEKSPDTVDDEMKEPGNDSKIDSDPATVTFENEYNICLSKLAEIKETAILEDDYTEPYDSMYHKKKGIRFDTIGSDEISTLTEEDLIRQRQTNTRLCNRRDSKVRQRQKRVIDCFKKFIAFLFSHIGLCSLVVAYSIMGGVVFKALEAPFEQSTQVDLASERNRLVTLLWDLTVEVKMNNASSDSYDEKEMSKMLRTNFKQNVDMILRNYSQKIHKATKERGWDGTDTENGEVPEIKQWSLPSALLYAITVTTTIGYGHVAPKTDEGRIVTIAYAVLGIPLTLLCLTNIGDVMAHGFRWLYGRVCCGFCCILFRPARRKLPDPERGMSMEEERMVMQEEEKIEEVIHVPTSLCILLMTGYILLGTLMFSKWESWDFVTGTYFCFITLSTIGFGDVVPGTDTGKWDSEEKLVLCAMYLVFGLSLIAMCFNLVQEDVKAKCKWLGTKLGIIEKPMSNV